MADKMLPPLVLELRAKASELIAEVKSAATATEEAAASTQASATKIEAASARAGESAAVGAEASAGGWSKFMGVSKAAAVGVVASAAVVGVESLHMASDFQSSMTLLQTAGGEQAKNMQTVSDGILALARATGTSTEQLSEGMYTVEKAGFQGAQGLNVLKAAAEGAKAENVDLSTATNALTSVMMSYHMSADKAIGVQNMLVAGSGKAKTSMQDYAGALSTVIPVASAAGVGFDQVAGAIATLTQHGTSAQEATQELSNTIRNLQAPNAVAQKAMQQLGLSVNDVSAGLADPNVGLQGTIEKITGAIKDHLGPAGTVVVDAFNKSASATQNLQTMMSKMPPDLAKMSQGLLDGSTSITEYTKAGKGLGGQSGAMAGQFLSLYKNADGFNQMLKSGTTDQRTAAATLKDVMGGATGLNTALMLSGESAQYFSAATKDVGEAGKKAGGDISTWGQTQKTFSVQMSKLKEDVQTAAIVIGTKLLPPVTAFVSFLTSHPGALIAFAGVITGVLVVAATAYFAKITAGAARNVADFAKMIASGARWVAAQAVSIAQSLALWAMYAAEWIAEQAGILAAWARQWITATVEWVAGQATSIAQSLALWAMYAGEWLAKQAGAFAGWAAKQASEFAGWAAREGAAIAKSVASWAAWAAQGIGRAAVAAAAGFASMASSAAGWIAEQAAQLVKSAAGFVVWAAEHTVLAGSFIAENVAMAASATAAFIAENAATLGIAAGIALLVGAIIWLVTHWSTAWDAIKTAAVWVYDNALKPIGDFIVGNVLHPIAEAAQWLGGIWSDVWNGIGDALKWVYDHTIGPIVDTIKNAIGGVSDLVHGISGAASAVGHFLGFANGGVVPGAPGEPRMAVVHGGEVVLSRDMLAGRQAPPPELTGTAMDANTYRPAAASSPTQAALSGSAPTHSSSGGGGGTVVNVNVQTGASPAAIAADVGWQLRKTA